MIRTIICVWTSELSNPNQITFIVTSPQHKCLGEWNSYERAPDSAKKKQQQQFTYGQTVQKNNKQFTDGQTVQKNNNDLQNRMYATVQSIESHTIPLI